MSELETFRAEARAWLEENCPAEMRTPAKGDEDVCWGGRNFVFQSDAQKLWLERCVAKGYTVPDWPKAYGGAGLSPQETKVLRQEMAKLGCRSPLNSFGIWMLGPALLKFGTEEQKVHYMGQIARGEIRWCQCYSEPGSGSDLVSMQTFGEDKGDHWVVNGQKIWTSYADKSDWIFCLVRTDKTNKYQGISFLLFDMQTPGVTTKPIKLISGNSPFCETFFDNVVVPKHQIVGELNRGWDVAKYLLGHEREMISAAFDAREAWNKRVPTGILNRWFEAAISANPPPAPGGKRIKLRYMTQARNRPPTFVIFGNRTDELPASYARYLLNGIRRDLDFGAVPVRINFRSSKNPFAD